MNTTDLGNTGEDRACEYLVTHKFQIVARNWKTSRCEIDIIAKKQGRVYFVEVKSRRSSAYGGGIAAITAQKIRQMSFAAEYWVQVHQWDGAYQLSVLTINDGVVEFIEDL